MKKEGFLIILLLLGISLNLLINIQERGMEKITAGSIIDTMATFSVSIQVKAVNITTTPTTTATEDSLYSYDVNATGNNLVYIVNSSSLFTISSNTGLISFTPRNGQNGSYNINISVYNMYGDIDSQGYTLIISAVNDAPNLDSIGILSGETGTQHTYTINASDEENDALTYSIPTKDSSLSMTINSNTGLITIPSGNDAGDYSATIRVSDGTNTDEEDITVHIVSTNYAPTILTHANSVSDNYSPKIREDQSIVFNITYNDDNGNSTASVQWKQKNGSLSFSNVGTGNSYTFTGAPGTYQVKAVVSDGINSVTSNTWTLDVDRVIDSDGDSIYDYTDNCKFITNSYQEDDDEDGVGDACEDDFDGDGISDADDFIDGDVNKIVATDSSGDAITLTFKIANGDNINQSISGEQRVEFSTTTVDTSTSQTIVEPIVEFDHNFASDKKIDLSNVSLKEEVKVVNGESTAILIVSGISLAAGETKTVYLDVLKDKSGVCIRDAEIDNADELSTDCSGNDETQIGCDGTAQGGFTCTKNTTLNKYKITGLSFSGIGEAECTESWSCTDWSTCSGATQTRTCTDNNNCGTENNKPSESQTCGSVAPTGGAVSGSSGGGGGGTTRGGAIGPSFSLDQEFIKIQLKKGSLLTKPIKVINTGDTILDFMIDLQELKDVLFISEPNFKLKKGEEKSIDLNVITGKGIAPGVYIGNIHIKTNNLLSKLVQTIIEIESEKVLFDISLDIPLAYKNVNPGQEITVYPTLLNMGGLTDVNITIEYNIKNSEGKDIIKEEENITMGTQATFTKKFLLPKDLPFGEYVLVAVVKYGDSVGTSSETFSIGEFKKGFTTMNIALIVAIFLSFILITIWQRKKIKTIEKRQLKRLKQLENKKTEIPNNVYKEKLERELTLLEKNYKDKYISKESYEKCKNRIEFALKSI